LKANLLLKHYILEVDLRHVSLYNDELAHMVQDKPADVLPLVRVRLIWALVYLLRKACYQFEGAALLAARSIQFPHVRDTQEDGDEEQVSPIKSIPKIQISIKSGLNMLPFRDLTANTMNKLVRIPGIVIAASVLSSRATKLHLACRACHNVKTVYPQGGLGGIGGGTDRGLPRVCDAPAPEGQKKDCPMDPYIIVHSKSTFSDHQVLKLQEAPDMVPVGELPRHMLLSADRYLTGQVVPGSRVIATGIYSTYSSGKDVR
jgi:DNA replication licensing factor MCM5